MNRCVFDFPVIGCSYLFPPLCGIGAGPPTPWQPGNYLWHFGLTREKWRGERTLLLLLRLPVSPCHFAVTAKRPDARLLPSFFPFPLQDLSAGQEQLPAGLRGRRRDSGRGETAPLDAGAVLFFFLLPFASPNQCIQIRNANFRVWIQKSVTGVWFLVCTQFLAACLIGVGSGVVVSLSKSA